MPCERGFFSHDGIMCQPCTQCEKGYKPVTECARTTDRVCTLCPKEFYSNDGTE